jgi:hypothetical protein
MLNELYSLLNAGHRVVILIIPYTEHEPGNATMARRLEEEVALTSAFYQAYLGFRRPHLEVLSTNDMQLPREELVAVQHDYSVLYQEDDPAVVRLVDSQRRSWASPNILFVPKCIVAIEQLQPDLLIAGEKHAPIADCFGAILEHRGHAIPSVVIPNLLDLRMSAGMDRRDTVETYIDVSEHEDFVLHKLALLRDEPSMTAAWLDHFETAVLRPAPERLKTGVATVAALESARILALAHFLANVRRLVPYQTSDPTDEVSLTWSDDLYRSLDDAARNRIERLVRALYRDAACRHIGLYRSFSAGKSGSLVLGLREFEDQTGERVSNLSVLKVGAASELSLEHASFKQLVAPGRTGAFMAVRPAEISVEGLSAVVYEDAHHFLGAATSDQLEPLDAAFAPGRRSPEQLAEMLEELFHNHLFNVLYKHGRALEVYSPAHDLSEFLAGWRLRPVQIQGDLVSDGVDYTDASQSVFELRLGEVDLVRGFARGYTAVTHEKVDVQLSDLAEHELRHFVVDRWLSVCGQIVGTRSAYYRSRLESVGVTFDSRGDAVVGELLVRDPIARLESVVNREYPNVTVSPVHGDLHSGNVLCVGQKLGIIDYGKMRARWPALYDVAFLLVDLKVRLLAARCDVPTASRLERSSLDVGRWRTRRSLREVRDLMRLLSYEELSSDVRSLGSSELFDCLVAAICMGRLKFDLASHQHHIALIIADAAMGRIDD